MPEAYHADAVHCCIEDLDIVGAKLISTAVWMEEFAARASVDALGVRTAPVGAGVFKVACSTTTLAPFWVVKVLLLDDPRDGQVREALQQANLVLVYTNSMPVRSCLMMG